jgi:peptidoglycan-N-acetylglucosamine deacetylase
MAPLRRPVALGATLLTIMLAGCASDGGPASAWHAPSPSTAASGLGGGVEVWSSSAPSSSPSPSPSRSPRRSPSAPPSRPPSPTPPATRSIPAPPTGTGTGPGGSITTTGSDAVALTFDDGPGPNTAQVLDLLKQYGIHATFCVIGRNIAGYPAMIKRIVDEGHTLCNHTWSHDLLLSRRTPDQITAELQRTNDAIHAIVPDAPIEYFRNPGGNFSPLTVSIAAGMGMKSLFWNVDPRDWTRPGVPPIINNVLSHTHQGSIVLMHDGGGDRSQTVQALQTILPALQGRFTLIPMPV